MGEVIVIVVDRDAIKSHVVVFFKDLYTDLGILRPFLDVVDFKCLDDLQKDWLERPIDEGEVQNVIWGFAVES